MPCSFGSFTVTGEDAQARFGIGADFGSFALVGQDAILLYTAFGTVAYSLSGAFGAFVETGLNASLVKVPVVPLPRPVLPGGGGGGLMPSYWHDWLRRLHPPQLREVARPIRKKKPVPERETIYARAEQLTPQEIVAKLARLPFISVKAVEAMPPATSAVLVLALEILERAQAQIPVERQKRHATMLAMELEARRAYERALEQARIEQDDQEILDLILSEAD